MSDEIQTLDSAPDAHTLIDLALALIQNSSPMKQTDYLDNEEFVLIVKSGLDGLDDCKVEHQQELIAAFAVENQPRARMFFGK